MASNMNAQHFVRIVVLVAAAALLDSRSCQAQARSGAPSPPSTGAPPAGTPPAGGRLPPPNPGSPPTEGNSLPPNPTTPAPGGNLNPPPNNMTPAPMPNGNFFQPYGTNGFYRRGTNNFYLRGTNGFYRRGMRGDRDEFRSDPSSHAEWEFFPTLWHERILSTRDQQLLSAWDKWFLSPRNAGRQG